VERWRARQHREKYGYTEVDDHGNVKVDSKGQPIRHAGRMGRREHQYWNNPQFYTQEEVVDHTRTATADDYRTLGVNPGASDDEIKRAYRRESMKYHPDQNKDPGASNRFREVNEAFERFNIRGTKHTVNVSQPGAMGHAMSREKTKGTYDLRMESRRRQRAEKNIIEEFCRDYPDECKTRKNHVKARGFCDAFPDKCAGDDMWKDYRGHVGGMKRRNDMMEAENTARKRRAQVRVNESKAKEKDFWLSNPGKFVNAVGGAFYEARDTSRQAVKSFGSGYIGLDKPQRYVPRPKKAYKPKRRAPRRYKMRASDAMKDVDAVTNRIIG
jgi:curved DNA-binding protein CbpA